MAVSKNSITQENIRCLGVKKDYETSTKRQISNYRLYKLFKTQKMSFINQNTNKQGVLHLALTSISELYTGDNK